MSLKPEDLTDNVEGLAKNELRELDIIFKETYLMKYPIVGKLEDEGSFSLFLSIQKLWARLAGRWWSSLISRDEF